MRRPPALLALLALLLAGLAPSPGEPEPLLRGADPAQFDLVGISSESLAIVDGEVRLVGKPLGYFATRREFSDFVLTFEYRFDPDDGPAADSRANSGVLLHCGKPGKVWPSSCVQVQLAQADPGAIFAMGEAKCNLIALADPTARKAAVKPLGEWNALRVTCRGGTIACVLNGVEVARAEDVEPRRGPVGWQSEGRPVRFREIRVGALP